MATNQPMSSSGASFTLGSFSQKLDSLIESVISYTAGTQMLRQLKTKEGRSAAVPFLRVLARLKLLTSDTANHLTLQIVFSELEVRLKDE